MIYLILKVILLVFCQAIKVGPIFPSHIFFHDYIFLQEVVVGFLIYADVVHFPTHIVFVFVLLWIFQY